MTSGAAGGRRTLAAAAVSGVTVLALSVAACGSGGDAGLARAAGVVAEAWGFPSAGEKRSMFA